MGMVPKGADNFTLMAKAIQRRKKNLFGFGDSRKRTRAQEQADRLGERTRIASSRMETAGRGLKSSKPVAEKTYHYEGGCVGKIFTKQ